jgi:thymidylate synthase (FAD)
MKFVWLYSLCVYMQDERFRVEVLNATPDPERVIWQAMHQDYSAAYTADERVPGSYGEAVVRHLLEGDRGHYGCYAADTEVLTERGWWGWPRYVEAFEAGRAPRVLAVDVRTMAGRFEEPRAVQRYRVEGERLYCVEGQGLSFWVTGDHRMVVSYRRGPWEVCAAREAAGRPVRYALAVQLADEERVWPSLPGVWQRYLGAAGLFLAYGQVGCEARLGLRLGLRGRLARAWLSALGVEVYEEGVWLRFGDERLEEWLRDEFASGVYPSWLLRLPVEGAQQLWRGLRAGGEASLQGGWVLYSREQALLGWVQASLHVNGLSSGLTCVREGERPLWRLRAGRRVVRRVRRHHQAWEPYWGEVYCATVSTGALLVRRQGKPVVLGNCLEHPQITFAVGYYPHLVMQQARTHRVGVSFDVQCVAGSVPVRLPVGTVEMQRLYEAWQRQPEQLRGTILPVLDEERCRFGWGRLAGVVATGRQPVYRVELSDGRVLFCTAEHCLYTETGWRTLAEAVGLAEGLQRRCRVWTHVRADLPIAALVAIRRVELVGEEETYDLQVEGPWHNYVAGGVVVHNSFRYTGKQIVELGRRLRAGEEADVEAYFYVPASVRAGRASTRSGRWAIDERALGVILQQYRSQAQAYRELVEDCGLPYEDARCVLGMGVRQHFVVSFNCRSLMHFFDLRAKADAQLEIRQLCEQMWPHFEAWCPHIAAWYRKHRWGKARLAP